MREYQLEYASGRPQMYDIASRKRKAIRMVCTLKVHFENKSLKDLTLLDIGSSSGIIDNYLAHYFKKVVGIDIDRGAIAYAKKNFTAKRVTLRKNLLFKYGDAMKLSFKENSFDVVVCTHIYEHVPDSSKLFSEIYRVLKPHSVCYLAALNKWWIMEPHYNLPFLSWLPKSIANLYLKIFRGKDIYYENILSYWQLKKLVNKFKTTEYTDQIFKFPERFGYGDAISSSYKKLFAKIIAPLAKYTAPTFFWILEKK